MSKAAAIRFMTANVGRVIETTQTGPNRPEWTPGPRVLDRKGATKFVLNGSTIQLTPAHRVTHVTATSLTVEWRTGTAADSAVIHTTTYTVTT